MLSYEISKETIIWDRRKKKGTLLLFLFWDPNPRNEYVRYRHAREAMYRRAFIPYRLAMAWHFEKQKNHHHHLVSRRPEQNKILLAKEKLKKFCFLISNYCLFSFFKIISTLVERWYIVGKFWKVPQVLLDRHSIGMITILDSNNTNGSIFPFYGGDCCQKASISCGDASSSAAAALLIPRPAFWILPTTSTSSSSTPHYDTDSVLSSISIYFPTSPQKSIIECCYNIIQGLVLWSDETTTTSTSFVSACNDPPPRLYSVASTISSTKFRTFEV